MSRIETIIGSMSTELQAAVIELRLRFPSLMELDSKKARRVQQKAVFLNYIDGTGRKLGSVPHYYEVPDGKNGTYEKETYFTYCDRVH